ncbi:MAG: hypothetical protein AAFR66_03795 [Bacteroidota bacterium]
MLRLKLLFLLAGVVFMSSCTSEVSEVKDPLTQQIESQLVKSCNEGASFSKRAGALGTEGSWEEQQVKWDQSADGTCPLTEELEMLLKESYLTAKVSSNYDVIESGDTIIANLQQGLRKSSALQQQKVVYGEEDRLAYVYTLMKQDSWLYSTDIRLAVFFDESGRYENHTLTVKTDIVGISEGFHAGIRGEMQYE